MQQKLEEQWGLEEGENTDHQGSLKAASEAMPCEMGIEGVGVPCRQGSFVVRSMGSGV